MFTFVNLTNMPKYLNQSDFNNWLSSFISVGKSVLLSMTNFSPDLEIEFSNEQKTKEYGSHSIDEIKNMIRSEWDTNPRIEDIINGINDYSDYIMEGDRLPSAIRDNNTNSNYSDIRGTLDGWFNEIAFSSPILGEYINWEKKIILYTKNIERDRMVGRSDKQSFERVFVHELFHAYHYRPNSVGCDLIELVERDDYTSNVVKESLASAFECYYCTLIKIPGADELKKTWGNHSVRTYPYSGALHFVKHNQSTGTYYIDSASFVNIFGKSETDMDIALRALLYSTDFYYIKNSVEVMTKTVIKSVPTASKIVPQVFVVRNIHSFNDESGDNYLFAPDKPYYNVMKKVQQGDIIFHIFRGHLRAISIAKGVCYYSKDSHNRHACGNYIDSAYSVFDSPVDISNLKTHVHYPNKQGNPHYISLQNDLTIMELLLNEALKVYPNNVVLRLVKDILFV